MFPQKTNWHLFHFFGTIMSHLMGNLSKTRKYLVGLLETTFPFSSYFYYILSRKPSIQLLLFCIPFRNHKLYSCSEFQMEMLSKSPFVLLFQVGSRLPRLIKAPKWNTESWLDIHKIKWLTNNIYNTSFYLGFCWLLSSKSFWFFFSCVLVKWESNFLLPWIFCNKFCSMSNC